MGYIETDSNLLAGVTFASENHKQALIDAVSSGMDRHLKRYIVQAQRDQVLINRNGAEIFLPAYPVDHVARVCTEQRDVLTITGTGQVATFSVGESALKLLRINSGANSANSLAVVSYSTLSALAVAISAVPGFTATVAAGYENHPTADLVRGRSGSCHAAATLAIWIDGDSFQVDHQRGWVSIRGYCPQEVRVVWTGGFNPVPADLQKVCADLVANAADPKNGAIVSESMGKYSYTISNDLNSLPVTSKAVLDSYKNRGC